MKYITKLQEEVKKLKKENRDLKKENKLLSMNVEVQGMYINSTEDWVPGEFYFAVLERYKRLQRHTKVMYGAYIILAIATTLMIINFYMVV